MGGTRVTDPFTDLADGCSGKFREGDANGGQLRKSRRNLSAVKTRDGNVFPNGNSGLSEGTEQFISQAVIGANPSRNLPGPGHGNGPFADGTKPGTPLKSQNPVEVQGKLKA